MTFAFHNSFTFALATLEVSIQISYGQPMGKNRNVDICRQTVDFAVGQILTFAGEIWDICGHFLHLWLTCYDICGYVDICELYNQYTKVTTHFT